MATMETTHEVTCRSCGARASIARTGQACDNNGFVAYCCKNGHTFPVFEAVAA